VFSGPYGPLLWSLQNGRTWRLEPFGIFVIVEVHICQFPLAEGGTAMTGNIVFVGFQGGSCSTLSQPLEIFSYALSRPNVADEKGKPPYRFHVATPEDQPLDRVGFFRVEPTISISDHPSPDLIFLTSMSLEIEKSLGESKSIIKWIKSANKKGSIIAAVCPSQAALAEAGLLKGRKSAVHWSLLESFKQKWPDVNWQTNGVVIDEDRIITCCGGTAATDLSLYLIHKMFGEEIAIDCARWFVADMPRTRLKTPAPIFEAPALKDDDMKSLQDWLHTHFSEDIKLSALAEQFNMTQRTFYRHFQKHFGDTPRVYLQKLRIASARKLLESDNFTIDEISRKVGYDDVLFFRRLFKRFTNMTPNEFREKYKFRSMQMSRAERESLSR
jgi:transcriptional regulator GlxA family with amidase domain